LFKTANKLSKNYQTKLLTMLLVFKSLLEIIMSLAGIIYLNGCYSG